jgi:hypothetical protein
MKHVSLNLRQTSVRLYSVIISLKLRIPSSVHMCVHCEVTYPASAIKIAPAALFRVVAASQVTYREPQVSYRWSSIWHTKESVDDASVLRIDTDLERESIYCEPP